MRRGVKDYIVVSRCRCQVQRVALRELTFVIHKPDTIMVEWSSNKNSAP